MRVLPRWPSSERSAAWDVVARLTAAIPTRRYRAWIERYDTLSDGDRTAIRSHLPRLPHRPLISILVDATGPDHSEARLGRSLNSLQAQLYPEWEACVTGTLKSHALVDARIRWSSPPTQPGEAAALNAALRSARGEFIAVLEVGDRLAEHALYAIAVELAHWPQSDIVYSDEDFSDDCGLRSWPYFKPDWDPDLALGQDLLGRLAVMRASAVTAVGCFRNEFDPAAQYDLHLRIAHGSGADRIRHVPAVLYHREIGASPPPEFSSTAHVEAAREAVWQHCRAHDPAVIGIEPVPGVPFWNRVLRAKASPEPLVSVLVPTRDRAALMRACAEGVLHRTDYQALELLVLDNGSVARSAKALLAELARDPRVTIIECPGPFNFAAIINRGAAAARGDILLLLNNDIEVLSPGWLGEMVSQVVRPGIGAVGARLLFPDGRVQHGGIALSPEPRACNIPRLAHHNNPGYFGQLALLRSYSAVTGACLAMRRELFLDLGGLDEQRFSVTFNDVDLCLRVIERGYRVVCTPLAELMHRESMSRGIDGHGAKRDRALAELDSAVAAWRADFVHDRYSNPNFRYTWRDGTLILSEPRSPKPWQQDLL